MSINLSFSNEDWERLDRDWSAWWQGELDRPMVIIHGFDPARRGSLPRRMEFTSSFPLEVPADQVLDHYQAHLEAERFYGDAWPKWWPNFGPGILAGFLGARVNCAEETVWFSPMEEAALRDLHLSYDTGNPWWHRVLELTRLAAERWGDSVSIAHTDLGGNLDVLASFLSTERLLTDLIDEPLEVERLAGEITQLWLRYYNELDGIIAPLGRGTTPWAPVRAIGRCYMLQSDFSYMISPRMFERFVLPDLSACCEALDHAFYHLDGKGQLPHLDMLLSLPRLRGIQWVPGDGSPPPEDWLPVLCRIREAGKLCQIDVTAKGALRIARELGGKGFVFSIMDAMTEEEAPLFLRRIREVNRQAI